MGIAWWRLGFLTERIRIASATMAATLAGSGTVRSKISCAVMKGSSLSS